MHPLCAAISKSTRDKTHNWTLLRLASISVKPPLAQADAGCQIFDLSAQRNRWVGN